MPEKSNITTTATPSSPSSKIKRKERHVPLLLQRPGARRTAPTVAHRGWTVSQLEEWIWKTSQTIVDCQKQIQRGEETYYEETAAHGSSVYKGFDTFIDARDVGNSNSGVRRMPGDCRWFSGSCSNIARHMKQRLFVPTAPAVPTTTTAGQKRPAADQVPSGAPPAKERKTTEEAKASPAPVKSSTTTSKADAKRRTTRKRKAAG